MSDLSQYSLSETSRLKVRLPNGELSDIEIELYSKYTKHYQKARSETMRDSVESMMSGKEVPEEEIIDRINKLLAKCTKSWKNLEWEGKKLKCSEKKALEIYSNPGFSWLRDQVDEFIHGAGNFLGKPKKG